MTSFIKHAYCSYFGKFLAPHIVCKSCTEYLRLRTKGKKSSLKFGIPMIWREPTNHVTDCYFCAIDLTGINRKNRSSLAYPDLDSARRPVVHCEEIPIPVFKEFPETSDDASSSFSEDNYDEETPLNDRAPQPLSQNELNDLARDLNLPKCSDELLASRLKEKNLLEDSVRISFYCNRHQEFLPFFSEENDFVYYTDIIQLLHNLGVSQCEAKD